MLPTAGRSASPSSNRSRKTYEAPARAIRTVAAGEALLSPTATRALITRFLAAAEPREPVELVVLTAREREGHGACRRGRSNADIAQRLVVSPLTVRIHVQRAMTQLGARDRTQLVVIAYRPGLVRPCQETAE
jgi:DNA-binding NarL/FixJ family response regulator